MTASLSYVSVCPRFINDVLPKYVALGSVRFAYGQGSLERGAR